MRRWLIYSLMTAVIIIFTGCYTVVMVPETVSSRNQITTREYEEYDYDELESDSEIAESPVIQNYYLYGDLWPGYVVYDPFWTSPYWYHYHSAWNHWWYDDYYGWNYNSWPYYGWGRYYSSYSPGYYYPYRPYRDPYYTYWSGYYSPNSYQRRPFAHRDALRGSEQQIPANEMIPASRTGSTDRRLGKSETGSGPGFTAGSKQDNGKSPSSDSSRRVRRSSTTGTATKQVSKPASGSPTPSRSGSTVRRPSSSSSSSAPKSSSGSSSGSGSSRSSGNNNSGNSGSKRR